LKKLTKDMIFQKNELEQRIRAAADDVQVAVRVYNDHNAGNRASIEDFVGFYNQIVVEAQAFTEEVHDAQLAFQENRSDTWRNSENGGVYEGWVDRWSISMDEIGVDCHDDIEEPEMEAADMMSDLPEQP